MLSYQLNILILLIIFITIFILLYNEIIKIKQETSVTNDKFSKKNFVKNNKYKKYLKYALKLNEPRKYDAIKNYDIRKMNDPLEQPTKRPDRYVIGNIGERKYLNIATQGYPDNFRLLGTLNSIDYNSQNTQTENNDNSISNVNSIGFNLINPNNILQLFGRQKYPGSSSEYEYYTIITSGNKEIKIHLPNKNEVYDGDDFYINELGKKMYVKLYPNDELRYNPFII